MYIYLGEGGRGCAYIYTYITMAYLEGNLLGKERVRTLARIIGLAMRHVKTTQFQLFLE